MCRLAPETWLDWAHAVRTVVCRLVVVVLPDDPRELLIGGHVRQRLWDIPLPVDVVPLRRSAFEARAAWIMSLPAIALREGKLEYDAALSL